ncbi:MAG: hypothetical protein FWG21_03395, partial [Oscillospiraceae bacterium]|nr:hypothetical protein [Oscillospiraceae bacterium]
MSEIIYCQLQDEYLNDLKDFCKIYWGEEHPLIHNQELFDWYYRSGDSINMVMAYEASEDGSMREIVGVCGYILTNSGATPDVFLSYILTKKGVRFGISLRLIEQIRLITHARTLNCNNIRRNTAGIYEFLGYTVADMCHFYRLNPLCTEVTLGCISEYVLPEISSKHISAREITTRQQLNDFSFISYEDNRPYKDGDYVARRYLEYPFHRYMLFRLFDEEKEAIVVIRKIQHEAVCMLRVVDFIGEASLIGSTGHFLEDLTIAHKAEYVDWYSFGVELKDMQQAGFTLSRPTDVNILPLYLSPPVYE